MEEDVRIQLFQSIENNDLDGVIDCIQEGVNLHEVDAVSPFYHNVLKTFI